MKSANLILLTPIIIFLATFACSPPPKLPATPRIEFIKAEFWDMGLQNPDSLNVTISFEDGDSNLGLDQFDYFSPRPNTIYLFRANSLRDIERKFFFDNDGELLKLSSKWNKPVPYDTLPDFVHPYNCTNYTTDTTLYYFSPIDGMRVEVKDTLYFQPHVDNFNYFIDFLIKQSDGSFERFPWESFLGAPSCGETFNTRFTRADVGTSDDDDGPIQGKLTYKMISRGFIFELRNKIFKFRIKIFDRSLNASNTVESEELTLDKIQVN